MNGWVIWKRKWPLSGFVALYVTWSVFSKIIMTVSPYLALLKYWKLYKLWGKILNTQVNVTKVYFQRKNLFATGEVMCYPISMSTLVEVMAWCLMAPSHYLHQCWFVIFYALWHHCYQFHKKCSISHLLKCVSKIMSKFPVIYTIEQGVHIWGMTIVSPFYTCLSQAEPMAARNEYWFCVRVLTRSGRLGWWAGYMNGLVGGRRHHDVMPWKCFLHYWSFVRGIHWSPADSPYNRRIPLT